MPRLPIPGSDEGTWGDILNNFLDQSHNPDGSLRNGAIPDGAVTPAKLSQSYIPTSEKGSANGTATLDATGKVPAAQLPAAGTTPDATTSTKGIVQLAGDLAGTAAAPTVPGLAAKADDAGVLHVAGNETVTGAKDFTGGITASGAALVVTGDSRLSNERVPTDGSVTDAKVAAGANIAQSKVANLTSDLASKANAVHTHAIADTAGLQTALDAKADETITVTGATSLTGGGDLTANRTISLVGDAATPGNSRYYGTNGTGTKGYHALPVAPTSVQSVVAGTGISVDSTDPVNPIVSATPVSSGVLLLESGGTVPPATAVGTIIFEKAAGTVVYDFKTGALPAGWSKHGAPTETFNGSGMTSTFAAGQGYHIDTLPPSDFTIEMAMTALASQATMFGPTITNAAGTGKGAAWYNAPAGLLTIAVSTWSYASSFVNGGGTFAVPNRIRLKKVGSLYTSAYSFDNGANWSAESASLSDSTTMTRVGIGSAFGSSTITVTEVVVKPVLTPGYAKGWWDGSAIQPLAV